MGRKITIASISAGILLLIAAAVFMNVYNTAMAQKKDGHTEAIQRAEQETELKKAESAETFNGLEQYIVITGSDDSGKPVYVFVPSDKKKKPVLKLVSDGISEKEALEAVRSEQNPQKLISVQLGMEGSVPVWEVKYIDDQNRYTYDLVQFTDGEIRKHIAIRK
ncbi:DUF5590 domain-containing protein [Metabacillus indicus]|uniref:cell wall elongation regulator TseB-like domain-containing protein n=1 Tax=Metabacillus indicus TaxID=246786 RepID=UPI000492EF2E|nr:DUF5590 domain-containing protein [Metabacillus indicus]KEZ50686.1 hypothetical protein AZ46_0208515 [Metabacillus indicus LMG 22858]